MKCISYEFRHIKLGCIMVLQLAIFLCVNVQIKGLQYVLYTVQAWGIIIKPYHLLSIAYTKYTYVVIVNPILSMNTYI